MQELSFHEDLDQPSLVRPEGDEYDYEVYFFWPSLDLVKSLEGQAEEGPCVYGPVPYLLAYGDFYDGLGSEPSHPLWNEEPVSFWYPEPSDKSSGDSNVPATPVPEYSSIVKQGLLFTVSSASSWRQRVKRIRRRIGRIWFKVRGLRRRRAA